MDDWKKSTETIKFKGTLLITDPCYLDLGRDDDAKEAEDVCDLIPSARILQHSTIYGDWSCTTFNTTTGKRVGKFCADGAMVCVTTLEEVEKFNPGWKSWWDKHQHTATLIEGFDGEAQIIVRHDLPEDDCQDAYTVIVYAKGTVGDSEEIQEFRSAQTGF